MKIRLGFVSNSSSSSFCIYGTTINTTDFIRGLIENFGDIPEIKIQIEENELSKKISNTEDDYFHIDYEEMEFVDEVLDILARKDINPNCYRKYQMNYDTKSEITIGRSYLDIDDNETGKEFKEKVEKFIKKIVKTEIEFDQMQEAFGQ
jgi:hypothetical protein